MPKDVSMKSIMNDKISPIMPILSEYFSLYPLSLLEILYAFDYIVNRLFDIPSSHASIFANNLPQNHALMRYSHQTLETFFAGRVGREVRTIGIDSCDMVAIRRRIRVIKKIGEVSVAMNEPLLVNIYKEVDKGCHELIVAVGFFTQDTKIWVTAKG